MEWIETVGKTLEEAKEAALDELGVDYDEAEFVVVDEPKQGLFGRTRGQARVRSRVMPKVPRPKTERRGRRTKKDTTESTSEPAAHQTDNEAEGDKAESAPKKTTKAPRSAAKKSSGGQKSAPKKRSASGASSTKEGNTMTLTLEDQITSAEAFLSGLVDAFGLTGTVETRRVDDSTAELNIVGDDLGLMIGPRGNTITAIQELTRISLQRQAAGSYEGRVRVDVGGYREQRRQALGRFAVKIAEQVLQSGTPKALEPMSASDRKAVHDAINEVDGVHTSSEGQEPRRWVMILPDES